MSLTVLTQRFIDLRDPSTIPLNFTKSINLALSERGINSIRNAKCDGLLDDIIDMTVPMHGRMIHRQNKDGKLFQESQKYDAHGRVCYPIITSALKTVLLTSGSISKQWIVPVLTKASWTHWIKCLMLRCTSIINLPVQTSTRKRLGLNSRNMLLKLTTLKILFSIIAKMITRSGPLKYLWISICSLELMAPTLRCAIT